MKQTTLRLLQAGFFALCVCAPASSAFALHALQTADTSCEDTCHALWDPVIRDAQQNYDYNWNIGNDSCCGQVGGTVTVNGAGPDQNGCSAQSECQQEYISCMQSNPAIIAAQIQIMLAQGKLAQCLAGCEDDAAPVSSAGTASVSQSRAR